MTDYEIESELSLIYCEMVNAQKIEKDRADYLVQRQRELVAMRSVDCVAKMEEQKGLV